MDSVGSFLEGTDLAALRRTRSARCTWQKESEKLFAPLGAICAIRRTSVTKKLLLSLIVASNLLANPLMAKDNAPLKLVQVISLPDMKSGDFDHFALDLAGKRLFLTGEVNQSIEVFDLRTNKRIHSIKGVDTPHSMLYLPESDQRLLYVASGGEDAKMDHTMINIVDVNTRKRVADITVDSTNIEAMALEQNGPRLYVNIRDRSLVGIVDREKRTVLSTWNLDGLEG